MSTKPTHQKSPDRLYAWMLTDPQHPQLIGEIIRQTNGDVGLQYDLVPSAFAHPAMPTPHSCSAPCRV